MKNNKKDNQAEQGNIIGVYEVKELLFSGRFPDLWYLLLLLHRGDISTWDLKEIIFSRQLVAAMSKPDPDPGHKLAYDLAANVWKKAQVRNNK